MCAEYNGWTNYETWLVNIWLSNDEGTNTDWEEVAAEELADADGEEDRASWKVGDRIKDELTAEADELVGVTGLFTDLLGAALSSVDWSAIGSAYVEVARENA